MFHVKPMSPDDFAFAVNLTDTMDWNLVEEDFTFMLRLEPTGCFILCDNSHKIGLATTIRYGPVGWLGNVIIDDRFRQRGAGSKLVQHALTYLSNNCVRSVGLYAYLDKLNFYTRLGFSYDSIFIVFNGKGLKTSTKYPTPSNELTRMKEDSIPKVIAFDGRCLGYSRKHLLQALLRDPQNQCYLCQNHSQMLGFIIVKVYDRMAEIGPLVCRSQEIASQLLYTVIQGIVDYDIFICIPEKESQIIHTVQKIGFREVFRVARMFYGPPIVYECTYIAESLERG